MVGLTSARTPTAARPFIASKRASLGASHCGADRGSLDDVGDVTRGVLTDDAVFEQTRTVQLRRPYFLSSLSISVRFSSW